MKRISNFHPSLEQELFFPVFEIFLRWSSDIFLRLLGISSSWKRISNAFYPELSPAPRPPLRTPSISSEVFPHAICRLPTRPSLSLSGYLPLVSLRDYSFAVFTPTILLTPSLVISFWLTPVSYRSILRSVLFPWFSSVFLVVQHLHLHNNTGWIIASYT